MSLKVCVQSICINKTNNFVHFSEGLSTISGWDSVKVHFIYFRTETSLSETRIKITMGYIMTSCTSMSIKETGIMENLMDLERKSAEKGHIQDIT